MYWNVCQVKFPTLKYSSDLYKKVGLILIVWAIISIGYDNTVLIKVMMDVYNIYFGFYLWAMSLPCYIPSLNN